MAREKRSLRNVWQLWRGWFAIGIGVKRWVVLLALGALILGGGIGALLLLIRQRELLPDGVIEVITLNYLPSPLRVMVPLLLGIVIVIIAILGLGNSLVAPFRRPGEDLALSISQYKERSRGPKIVAIGGGTGLPGLLRGLTAYTNNITAIVTVADDGGSSGRIRRELGVLPPGDFRNNIAALARDEELMTQLMQYRFSGGPQTDQDQRPELQGHAFGNLLLVALAGITGSFDEALAAAGNVLALKGRVFPSTLANVVLEAEVSNEQGQEQWRVIGESMIPKSGGRIERVAIVPGDVSAYPPAVQAILAAELVVIGPGSLYTSILPNLLVPDIAKALHHTRARRIYICNLATQPGETDNYSVEDHVNAIIRHTQIVGEVGGQCLDLVVANNNLSIPSSTGGGNTIFVKPAPMEGITMVTADLVDEERPWRHDSVKLARVVIGLASPSSK